MSSNNEIVVLGASFAGLQSAHYILKHVIPALPQEQNFHLTLIGPSDEFFWRVGVPRTLVNEKDLPFSKIFYNIPDGFKQYGKQFTFVRGAATGWDAAARKVSVRLHGSGEMKEIAYYALVIATGVATTSPLMSINSENPDATKEAIHEFNKAVASAKSIIVAGGGPAGVETAGELGEYLNGAAGMFASRPSKPKAKITLITDNDKLLPILRPAIAKQAETLLNRVGVDVIYGTKVSAVSPEGAGYELDKVATGPVTVTLSNGKTMDADLFLPAHGVRPNTSWVPKEFLTERSYIDTNTKTLRVDAAGPHVYCVGDVASCSRGGALEIQNAIPILGTNIKRDLLAGEGKPTGKDRERAQETAESQLVPIGRSKGVGAFNGMKFPSIMVWMIKGRDYMSGMAMKNVNGSAWQKESKWVPTEA